MLIDRQFLESVAFLVADQEEDGQIIRKALGTAFFVLVRYGELDGVGYIVTARHVVNGSRKYGPLYIRLNREAGGFQDFRTAQDDWILHDKTDVAIMRVVGFQGCRYVYIPDSYLATEAYIREREIGEGDEVFFVGLFSEHHGKQRNHPVVRFGNISLMPYEEIYVELDPGSHQNTPILAYLIEAKSWGGHSGSPAFVYLPPYRRFGIIEIATPEDRMKLLGLIHGHYAISKDVQFLGELRNYGTGYVGVNVGMAMVIPAHHVRELLMREDVVEDRARILGAES